MARGAVGICCQKASGADALARAAVGDICIVNEVVVRKLARLTKQSRL
jgi:D-serine deaminase-like pyridoxal phosphate-dependent protein